MMNKAKYIREKLGLSREQAGMYIMGLRNKKAAYDTFYRLEANNSYTASTDRYFDLLILMIKWRDDNKRGTNQSITEFVKCAELGGFDED